MKVRWIFTSIFLLSHAQIMQGSYQTNKINLLGSSSSEKQNHQSIQQEDKATDQASISLVQAITEINKTTDHIKKIAISLDEKNSISLDQVERNQKIIMAQNEEILKTLDEIKANTTIIKQRTECCSIS